MIVKYSLLQRLMLESKVMVSDLGTTICGEREFRWGQRTYIMGILNVTPDSFSGDGLGTDVDSALNQAVRLVEEGADMLDVGGESTRPDSEPVSADEELGRVIPVIERLVGQVDVPVSIDTYKSEVARRALESGASMINDVWGFKKDNKMALVAQKHNVACCLMHNRIDKFYNDLIPDMIVDLEESIKIATDAGVAKDKIIIDVGIGFAKTLEHNLEIMKQLERFKVFGLPILLGTSRKSIIGLSLDLPVDERVEGTIATTVFGYMKGCRIFRVHDVLENHRALLMTEYMNGEDSNG